MTRPPCGGPAMPSTPTASSPWTSIPERSSGYFQVVPSDNWDLDATHESMLVDLVIGGVERKALIETSKIGWSVVLDREAGRFINVFRTGYATSSPAGTDTGSTLFNSAQIPTMDDVDSDRIFEVCPYFHGARNLNAPSFSPETGLYYLGINKQLQRHLFSLIQAHPSSVSSGRVVGMVLSPSRKLRSPCHELKSDRVTSAGVPPRDTSGGSIGFGPIGSR